MTIRFAKTLYTICVLLSDGSGGGNVHNDIHEHPSLQNTQTNNCSNDSIPWNTYLKQDHLYRMQLFFQAKNDDKFGMHISKLKANEFTCINQVEVIMRVYSLYHVLVTP